MKNNQFRKLFTEEIRKAGQGKIKVVCVDNDNKYRMAYLYNITNYKILGTISIFTGDSSFSIKGNKGDVLVTSLHNEFNIVATYLKLDKVIITLEKFMQDIMKDI
jgi:hypothetical protein